MKRFIGLSLLAVLLSIATYLVQLDNSIEQIVDVHRYGENQMLVLEKEVADDVKETIVNLAKPSYQLVLTDTKGFVIQKYTLPKDKPSTFSEYNNISVDAQGTIYIHRAIKNSENYYLLSEEIFSISPDGTYSAPLFKADYSKDIEVEYSLVTRAYIIDRFMYVVHRDPSNNLFWKVTQINLYSKESALIQEIHTDPELYIYDLIYLGNQQVIMAGTKGQLYHADKGVLTTVNYASEAQNYYPARLLAVNEHSFGFYDQLTRDVLTFDIDAKSYKVLKSAAFNIDKSHELNYSKANTVYLNNDLSITGAIRVNLQGQRYIFLDDEKGIAILTHLEEPDKEKAWLFLKLLGAFELIALALWCIHWLYYRSGGSLILKFTAFLLPLILTIPLVSLTVSFVYFNNLAEKDLLAELHRSTTERVPRIDAKALESIDGLEDYNLPVFKSLEEQRIISADAFNSKNLDTYSRWYYSVIYRYEEGKLHAVVGDAITYWATTDYIYGEKGNQIYLKAAENNESMLGQNSDLSGDWVFSLTPIVNDSGKVVGLFEVGTGRQSYVYFIQSYYGKLVTLNMSMITLVLLLFLVIVIRVFSPLRRLSESARQLTQGNWGTTVTVRSHDEIGVLSGLFNKMSLFIKDHIEELTKLNAIYYKFIPLQFFHLMNKKSIVEVGLGDCSKQEMTIVYINTFNYFDLAKGKNSEGQLELLNQLFAEYAAAIHDHEGIVGEFRNAGLLALFKNQQDALDTAYTITQRIKVLNPSIMTTVNIHFGDALLGVVGDENRMTTAVISSCVNEAVALDKYAGKYNCTVLMTEDFVKSYKSPVSNLRYIGDLLDEQRQVLLRVNEWLETVPVAHQSDYLKSQSEFATALRYFIEGKYEMAKKGFVKVIKENPRDLVSKEYLYKCEKALVDSAGLDKVLGRF